MRPLTILALVLVPLAACVPPPAVHYVTRYTPGGGVVSGDRVFFLVEESTAHEDGRLAMLSCPIDRPDEVLACERQYVSPTEPRSELERAADETRRRLRLSAATDHACDRVEVQSGSVADGFWLLVCDEQRFYQLDGESWVDRTPAE